MQAKIGLFVGGMEQYWTETGMEGLREIMERDARGLEKVLQENFDVVYPGLATNVAESEKVGRILRQEQVDIALMYHACYVDDAMSLVFLKGLGDIFPVLFFSQGLAGIPKDFTLLDAARTWGNNSAVQLGGTLKRMRPNLKFGFVFGALNDPGAIKEIDEYARAIKAVKKLGQSKVAYLPHRSAAVPMYDTYPDDTMMMSQTGVEIIYLYTQNLLDAMNKVPEEDTEILLKELYHKYDIVEPPEEEVRLAAREALALEQVVKDNKLDALAIDMFPELTPRTGMLPCLGMARLIDQGIVVATEGDLSVSVSGIILQELTGKPVHFWEHLMFDEDRNWVLGGHEGGSAGFSMAKAGERVRLRNTQYLNFRNIPGAPYYGVVPEFITQPGPVTLLTLFRGAEGYEMRLASGESVDTEPRPVHFEHTIFKPCCPLRQYFKRITEVGVCHHFGLVHADVASELEKVAYMLNMKLEYLTK